MEKSLLICLTPVHNEAWILETFLRCTSLWADYIIIADQQSTDGSREIASGFPKVILVDNPSLHYDEVFSQKILVAEARKIAGKKLLFFSDADEFPTSNYAEKLEWHQMITAPGGSVFGFQWINLYPGFEKCWIPEGHLPWAYMDNSIENQGIEMHNPHLRDNEWTGMIKLEQVKVLHYKYTNWLRMKSKNRYYQCLERIKYPAKNAVDIYRMYHQIDNIPNNKITTINQRWFKTYESHKIPVKQLIDEKTNWFDNDIMKLFEMHGHELFKREAIWNKRWKNPYTDPRSLVDRIVHLWLAVTKRHQNRKWVKNIDLLIKNKIWN